MLTSTFPDLLLADEAVIRTVPTVLLQQWIMTWQTRPLAVALEMLSTIHHPCFPSTLSSPTLPPPDSSSFREDEEGSWGCIWNLSSELFLIWGGTINGLQWEMALDVGGEWTHSLDLVGLRMRHIFSNTFSLYHQESLKHPGTASSSSKQEQQCQLHRRWWGLNYSLDTEAAGTKHTGHAPYHTEIFLQKPIVQHPRWTEL